MNEIYVRTKVLNGDYYFAVPYVENKEENIEISNPSETLAPSCKAVKKYVENYVENTKNDFEEQLNRSQENQDDVLNSTFAKKLEVFYVLPADFIRNGDRDIYKVRLEQGTINSAGKEENNTNRVRTDFIPVGNDAIGTFSNGSTQKYGIRLYDENKTYLRSATGKDNNISGGDTWSTSSPLNIDTALNVDRNTKYVRLFFANDDTDTAITPQEVEMSFT